MKDFNLERYSDKVWQGGRKFGRKQAIGDVLEIIDRTRLEQDVKASWAYKQGWNDSLDVVAAVLALQGGKSE